MSTGQSMNGSIWNTLDPRGPRVKIIKVETSAGPTMLTLSCGCRSGYVNHFSYEVGEEVHCFNCGPCGNKGKETAK